VKSLRDLAVSRDYSLMDSEQMGASPLRRVFRRRQSHILTMIALAIEARADPFD
jgi:hypothetical protein